MSEMQVAQIRLMPRHIKDIDADIRGGIYPSRSEAIRAIVREHYAKQRRRR